MPLDQRIATALDTLTRDREAKAATVRALIAAQRRER